MFSKISSSLLILCVAFACALPAVQKDGVESTGAESEPGHQHDADCGHPIKEFFVGVKKTVSSAIEGTRNAIKKSVEKVKNVFRKPQHAPVDVSHDTKITPTEQPTVSQPEIPVVPADGGAVVAPSVDPPAVPDLVPETPSGSPNSNGGPVINDGFANSSPGSGVNDDGPVSFSSTASPNTEVEGTLDPRGQLRRRMFI